MDIGLFGDDDELRSLAVAAIAKGHQIVWISTSSAELFALAPGARIGDWEELLAGDVVQAVFIGRGGPNVAGPEPHIDERPDQLRRFVQAAVPVVAVFPAAFPADDSMLFAYELDMIRQDSRGVLLPYSAAREHPAQAALKQLADGNNGLGTWEQVVFERPLISRETGAVMQAFARDVFALTDLCGELDRVSAMGGGAELGQLASLSVQMMGERGVAVRWSVVPRQTTTLSALSVLAAHGTARLEMPEDRPWTLALPDQPPQVFANARPAEAMLDKLEAALRGELTAPSWLEACQAMELADAAARSAAKGKTIELHFEQHTEHEAFKGVMAAGGCLLLLALLFTAVVAAMAGWLNVRFDYWPHVLLAVLGLFLALQFLRFMYPKSK